ncbi:MAG: polysaccharide deacetylase family protein [Alphaproteobacteria bacterium]|nr:polysaccharide deacetylase family protein [Alphaproteobacteria bacterium]
MIVVTSWDDGHPADMKVAELLDRHGLSGTFFVPVENSEGLPVMDKTALRELDGHFEIGSHTYSHIRLDAIGSSRADDEIRLGKSGLEDILGHGVNGFCYPGGRITDRALKRLGEHGIRYARTIENFRLDLGQDRFHVPTTLQIFPHRQSVYIRNFIRRGHRNKRLKCLLRAMTSGSVWDALDRIALDCAGQEFVLHLWGHSWEIEKHDMWGQLESCFSRLRQLSPIPKTVAQSVAAMAN